MFLLSINSHQVHEVELFKGDAPNEMCDSRIQKGGPQQHIIPSCIVMIDIK